MGISTQRRLDLPTKVHFFEPENIRVKQISAAINHTLFLTEDGKVFGVGSNSSGQLGLGQAITSAVQPMMVDELLQQDIEQVAAGNQHSLFLNKTGEVFTCGSNINNSLGLPEVVGNCYVPTRIPALANYKISKVSAR